MKRAEFEKATFEEVIEKLIDEGNNITTYDELVDFARECIGNREFNLAINILEALRDDESEYYKYDYSMGTLEIPCGLNEKEHVEDLIEDDELIMEKGYDIFDFDGTGMLEINKIDELNYFHSDEEAVEQAIKDGIKIIPIEELPENFDRNYLGWIDTPENRKTIIDYCKKYLSRK